MKFLHIIFHFEYSEDIEAILDEHGIQDFVRIPMVEGKDRDGKHYGNQVYPGNSSVVQAQVPEEKLESVLDDLKAFKDSKASHRHLQALVLPVERYLE
ncbi:MAG: hypothetical protein K9J48_03500 [Desulfohalobiaceae bacterium]|nr:hypothetical protein [Desulfohalobiaceae bacterium]